MSRETYARALHLPLFGELSEEAERGILARYLEGLETSAEAAAEVDAWCALPIVPHPEVPDAEIATAHHRAVVRGYRPGANDFPGWATWHREEDAYVARVAGTPALREWYDRTFPAEHELDRMARRREVLDGGGSTSETDDTLLGAFVYCSAHVTVHATGWCTVPHYMKAPLDGDTIVDARESARRAGLAVRRW